MLVHRSRQDPQEIVMSHQKVTPFLWFDTQAEEAAKRPRREKIKKEKPKVEKATRAAKGGGKG